MFVSNHVDSCWTETWRLLSLRLCWSSFSPPPSILFACFIHRSALFKFPHTENVAWRNHRKNTSQFTALHLQQSICRICIWRVGRNFYSILNLTWPPFSSCRHKHLVQIVFRVRKRSGGWRILCVWDGYSFIFTGNSRLAACLLGVLRCVS